MSMWNSTMRPTPALSRSRMRADSIAERPLRIALELENRCRNIRPATRRFRRDSCAASNAMRGSRVQLQRAVALGGRAAPRNVKQRLWQCAPAPEVAARAVDATNAARRRRRRLAGPRRGLGRLRLSRIAIVCVARCSDGDVDAPVVVEIAGRRPRAGRGRRRADRRAELPVAGAGQDLDTPAASSGLIRSISPSRSKSSASEGRPCRSACSSSARRARGRCRAGWRPIR